MDDKTLKVPKKSKTEKKKRSSSRKSDQKRPRASTMKKATFGNMEIIDEDRPNEMSRTRDSKLNATATSRGLLINHGSSSAVHDPPTVDVNSIQIDIEL